MAANTLDSAEEVRFRSPSEAAGFTQASNLILLDIMLSDGAKVTYLLLRMYAWQGTDCFPGQTRMASERGVSERTIRNHLTEMETRNLITIEQRGKKLTNRYWIEPLDSVYSATDLPERRRESDRKISSSHPLTGKKLPPTDRKKTSAPTLEEDSVFLKDSGTLNVLGADAYSKLVLDAVVQIEGITGDKNSRPRYVQLREICVENNCGDAWGAALRSTQRRQRRDDLPVLDRPGAWFDKAMIRELDKRGIAVPTRAEKAEAPAIGGMIAASLAAATVAGGGAENVR